MLTIDHLEKCFGSTVLFRDLTFTVDGPAVLRALWAPGDTLLLDEPFTGMDPAAVQASIALLRERVEGRPVLLATHDRAAIDALGWPVLELQKLAQPGAACNSTNKGLQ